MVKSIFIIRTSPNHLPLCGDVNSRRLLQLESAAQAEQGQHGQEQSGTHDGARDNDWRREGHRHNTNTQINMQYTQTGLATWRFEITREQSNSVSRRGNSTRSLPIGGGAADAAEQQTDTENWRAGSAPTHCTGKQWFLTEAASSASNPVQRASWLERLLLYVPQSVLCVCSVWSWSSCPR
jgi:hypothetical protein